METFSRGVGGEENVYVCTYNIFAYKEPPTRHVVYNNALGSRPNHTNSKRTLLLCIIHCMGLGFRQ